MPRFEVNIFESGHSMDRPSDAPESPDRSIVTVVEASDQQSASDLAWNAWDAKYGLGQRPRVCSIKATRLPLRFA
jgi:hypothetical protein